MIAAPKLPPQPATLADLLAMPDEGHGYEIIDGEIVEKEATGEHGRAQTKLGEVLGPYHRRPGGRGGPGGWWFASETLVDFQPAPLRPDVAGWRRERLPDGPLGSVIKVLPDWICEILSPTKETRDTVKKKRIYHQHKVPHYWIIDPMRETLQVFRWTPAGYTEVLSAERDEKVRAEPFEDREMLVGVLFGDDEDDHPASG